MTRPLLTAAELAARKSRVPIPDQLPAAARCAISMARLGDAFADSPRWVLRYDHDAVRYEREWRDRDIIARALTGRPAERRRILEGPADRCICLRETGPDDRPDERGAVIPHPYCNAAVHDCADYDARQRASR